MSRFVLTRPSGRLVLPILKPLLRGRRSVVGFRRARGWCAIVKSTAEPKPLSRGTGQGTLSATDIGRQAGLLQFCTACRLRHEKPQWQLT